MPRIILQHNFGRDLSALRTGNRKNYDKANTVLMELERDEDVTARLRPETRLPDGVKYELADGYRIVLQRVADENALIALAVGKHDDVDRFLDSHKGHVFDPKTGRVRALRIATIAETTTAALPSAVSDLAAGELAGESPTLAVEESVSRPLDVFTRAMLEELGIPSDLVERVRTVEDLSGLDFMNLLSSLGERHPGAADHLLAYSTGSRETQAMVLGVARGELQFRPMSDSVTAAQIRESPEEFISFEDSEELEGALERGTLEDWQLFLHPLQRELVERSFEGPARLRGISGSGKTVVALHRARRLAQRAGGPDARVLFTTFNRTLAKAANRLLTHLCGPERSRIEVTHLHGWCRGYLRHCDLPALSFTPDGIREAQCTPRLVR